MTDALHRVVYELAKLGFVRITTIGDIELTIDTSQISEQNVQSQISQILSNFKFYLRNASVSVIDAQFYYLVSLSDDTFINIFVILA